MDTGIEVVGLEQMKGVFARLENVDVTEFFLSEFVPAANIMVTAIRSQTPVSRGGATGSSLSSRNHSPGTLRQSVGVRVGKGVKYPTVFTGPNRRGGVDGWYNHIVIGGHEYGGTRVAPNPFVRRAYDSAAEMIKTRVTERIKVKMQQLVER